MKKIIAFLICIFIVSSFTVCAFAEEMPSTDGAEGMILMEGDTGRILMKKDEFKRLPMASTTKVMTAVIVIENCDLDEVVTVSKNAANVEGSSIWLYEGEHMTVEDMLYGLMLSSGNDAAIALAEHTAGSVENFAQMMNEKARQLGLKNTNFVNPNGLQNENHYTCAYDLAIITSYAMNNDIFRKIVNTKQKEISWENHEYNRVLTNKNKNLWALDGANGVKTGYTIAAGRCFVASANRHGMELIYVCLDDYDMFEDSRKAIEYGFENYENVNIVKKGDYFGKATVENGIEGTVKAVSMDNAVYTLNSSEAENIEKKTVIFDNITAPVQKYDIIGKTDIYISGELVKSVPLAAEKSVPENSYSLNLKKVVEDYLF